LIITLFITCRIYCVNILHVAQNEVLLETQLYDLVAATPLGEFINSEVFTSHPEECLNLYKLYLNDFIHTVYRTTRDNENNEITVQISLHMY